MNPLLFRKIVFPAYHKLRNTKVLERINELEKNQWRSEEQLLNLQASKLQSLLHHAYETVPFYRQRIDALGIDIADIHRPENFRQLPLLTKKEINENRSQMIATNQHRSKLIPNSTSGSTGEALYFFTDMSSWAYRRAVVIRNEKWLGSNMGDRSAKLWGAPMDIWKNRALRGRLHSSVNNLLFLSSYDLSEVKMDKYIVVLNYFKPALLTSYPGPLTVFSEYLLKKEREIPSVKAIISSAETLYHRQKEIIERAFGCPVYNRYGCREFGDIAQECVKREGLHIHIDRFVVEILDEGLQPSEKEENGEIVITDLDNYGMPLIRYRIGDVASFKHKMCSCGRGLPLLSQIEGRTLDIVSAPNGNRLGGTFWTILFKSRPGIRAFQVIQEKLEAVTVNYVKDDNIENIDFSMFESRIKEKCGANFMIHFNEVKDIPKTTSGKTRVIVSKLEN